jgi:hypothetical protein
MVAFRLIWPPTRAPAAAKFENPFWYGVPFSNMDLETCCVSDAAQFERPFTLTQSLME